MRTTQAPAASVAVPAMMSIVWPEPTEADEAQLSADNSEADEAEHALHAGDA
jgi:hypothetical protein